MWRRWPWAGAPSGHSRLAGQAPPLPIRDAVQGWSQTEQVEGLVALITEDEFLIITWKDEDKLKPNYAQIMEVRVSTCQPSLSNLVVWHTPNLMHKAFNKTSPDHSPYLSCGRLCSEHSRQTCPILYWRPTFPAGHACAKRSEPLG